ncbi:TraX family protein [Acetobacterium carbinolicum]|uniref:TraX family protein n=1 Tax=Acetobacterium carbinolicum TaxID=52690 RepID=UPI0039C955A7
MTSTTLKVIALILMLLDHVGQFIPGAPLWLHWVGRISAPVFMFCMAWGFYYTHDRKKYLLRMYFFGLGMGLIDVICNNIVADPYAMISNNIFVTLFLVGVIVWLIEIRKTDKPKGNKYLALFAVYQILTTILCILAGQVLPLTGMMSFVGAITGNLIFNEGSFIFVFLGVLIYFNRTDKKRLILAYGLFCLGFLALEWAMNPQPTALLYTNYQWMMIGSLPLMLSYNGEKGRGMKYLFYVFYPLHIVVLFFIGNLFF